MMRRLLPSLLRALAPCILACAAGPALAQSAADEAQVLYERALQAIAEGRKDDASRTLMGVIEKEALHAGAYLEVALIQCSLGKSDEAERLFAIVETRFDPPRPILELIAEARDTGCDTWQPVKSTSFSLTRGVDNNVNQGARNPTYIIEREGGQVVLPLQAEFLPQRDHYTAFNLDHTRELTPNGVSGFLQLTGRRNDSLHRYDSASLYAGVDSPYRWGAWPVRASAILGATVLDGRLYQRQLQLQTRVGVPLPLPAGMALNVSGAVSRSQYIALTNFDSTLMEMTSLLSYRGDSLYASMSHAWMSDRAVRERPGGDRHGYATTLLARRPLWRFSAEVSFSYQSWKSAEAYVPGLIEAVRDQNTRVVRAALSYPVKRNQSLRLEARAVRNSENISIFQYDNRQIQLSWQWQR
ncbi:hypothetical protein B0920_17555 [Massilia sp. KIM]|uniref:tetratricopeptide repeat protein n=1 Tax=Massilia sp. KIM TaxID=1955422 RepID=UPI00098FF40C|nr:hypothetical protein [Massilia sp. KIM]OON60761.1 hypothetical protein B0920_17555 [Massilia sp. KIM]